MRIRSAARARHRGIGLLASGALVLGLMSACSSSGDNDAHTQANASSAGENTPTVALASAAVGPLTISDGYVPLPASPDVAAAYLTITNNGDTPDKLTKVTSDVTSMVMPMDEKDNNGVGSMTDLADVTIPAHTSMRFTPNHAHLMLEKPRPLKAGDHVPMTLTFTHAGTVELDLPVVALGETPTDVPTRMSMSPSHPSSSMSGMGSMSGMTAGS